VAGRERYGDGVDLTQFIDFTNLHGDGVLSTLGPDGEPQAAYISIAAMDDGSLVFDAKADSRKIANIARDGRVAVVIGGRDGASVQCEGTATVPVGEEHEKCAAAFIHRFPQFAVSVVSGAVVVHIRLVWARVGEYVGEKFVFSEVKLSSGPSAHSAT